MCVHLSSTWELGEPSGSETGQTKSSSLAMLQENGALVHSVDRPEHVHAYRCGLLDRQHEVSWLCSFGNTGWFTEWTQPLVMNKP